MNLINLNLHSSFRTCTSLKILFLFFRFVDVIKQLFISARFAHENYPQIEPDHNSFHFSTQSQSQQDISTLVPRLKLITPGPGRMGGGGGECPRPRTHDIERKFGRAVDIYKLINLV